MLRKFQKLQRFTRTCEATLIFIFPLPFFLSFFLSTSPITSCILSKLLSPCLAIENLQNWIVASYWVLVLLLSLFLLGFSIAGLRNGTEQLYWNTPILVTTCLECTSAHVQTLKWMWRQQSFEERIQFRMCTNEQRFEPLIYSYFIVEYFTGSHVILYLLLHHKSCDHMFLGTAGHMLLSNNVRFWKKANYLTDTCTREISLHPATYTIIYIDIYMYTYNCTCTCTCTCSNGIMIFLYIVVHVYDI